MAPGRVLTGTWVCVALCNTHQKHFLNPPSSYPPRAAVREEEVRGSGVHCQDLEQKTWV